MVSAGGGGAASSHGCHTRYIGGGGDGGYVQLSVISGGAGDGGGDAGVAYGGNGGAIGDGGSYPPGGAGGGLCTHPCGCSVAFTRHHTTSGSVMFPGGGGEGAGGKNTSSAAVAFVAVAFVAVAFVAVASDVSTADIAADPPVRRRKCRDERGVASREDETPGRRTGTHARFGGRGHHGGGRMACRAVTCGGRARARATRCARTPSLTGLCHIETAPNVRKKRRARTVFHRSILLD